jgi:precorrin-6A/cobalt-precorrin-6A reductase
MKVLILGGTGEARALASALAPTGVQVVSSLAGRVQEPRRPEGDVRIGGFGGADGLAGWLVAERVDAVVDATHPFAAGITANAVAACGGIPLLVLRRPGWAPGPNDHWLRVSSLPDVMRKVEGFRVFLTIGRQGLSVFAGEDGHWFLVRAVDPPSPPLPPHMALVLDRGPFTLDGELALMRRHRIDVLVTKDSGGPMTAAKLVAARELRLPVVMVDRPPLPAGVEVVSDVAAAVAWLEGVYAG